MPTIVLSELNSRSARAAKMPKTSVPAAVVVSIAATRTGEDLWADAAGSEVMDGVDQVVQVSAGLGQLPDHERVTIAKRLQALSQTRAVIVPTGRPVLIEAFVIDAGLEESVSLRIGG